MLTIRAAIAITTGMSAQKVTIAAMAPTGKDTKQQSLAHESQVSPMSTLQTPSPQTAKFTCDSVVVTNIHSPIYYPKYIENRYAVLPMMSNEVLKHKLCQRSFYSAYITFPSGV